MDEETAWLDRMPRLERPFALFGAAAGLFSILAIGSVRTAAQEVSPLLPMILTALAGAGAGVALRDWRALHSPTLARRALVLRVALITMATGAVSGGAVGIVMWGIDGFLRFAIGGGLVGLLFLPSCFVVFDSARRAGRGRLGSLVAATDRRTVYSTVLAGVAFAGSTQVAAILKGEYSNYLHPVVQAGLSILACVGATIAIVVLQNRDRHARAAFQKIASDKRTLDRVQHESEGAAGEAVDLGLGADQWGHTNDVGYRASARTNVVLKGSIEDATAAFDQCAQRRHRSLLVAVAGLSAVLSSVLSRW